MKALLTIISAAIFVGSAQSGEVSEVVRNRALADALAPSFVTVRYYLKRGANGEEPKLRIPYRCPNCNNTHYRDDPSDVENGIPVEIAGFVTAPDRVLVQDIRIPPEFIGRVAVFADGTETTAEEFERAPDREAVALRTSAPLVGAKPLVFDGTPPTKPRHFFIASEEGLLVSGFAVSQQSGFKRILGLNRDIYEGAPNTLILDENDRLASIEFRSTIELGREAYAPPSDWVWEPAAASHARIAALKAKVAKGLVPVYLQLEAKPKETSRIRFSFSSDDDEKDDLDAIGLVCADGSVLIGKSLANEQTARLQRLEATLPSGEKRELEFIGSLKEWGALVARFEGGLPADLAPLAVDERAAIEHVNEDVISMFALNRGGRIELQSSLHGFDGLVRVKGNAVNAEFREKAGVRPESENRNRGQSLTVGRDGRLVVFALKSRADRHSYSSPEASLSPQGTRLTALLSSPEFDTENVPRTANDRKRVAWFGAEVQIAGADIVREKKAASYIGGWDDRAALVVGVATNSPAAEAGVKEGDILISVKLPGSDDVERLRTDRDLGAGIEWNRVFEAGEFTDVAMLDGMVPWTSLEGGVNGTFAKFGVGAEVEVAWVRDGERMCGRCRLALAPIHFENAPRKRSKELGITVADMTDEVRRYFKFDANAPGVVIVKTKSGGPAAVAGLKPLEIITGVNGVDIRDAKDFAEKVKGAVKFNFSVRRLMATRMVPIDL